MREKCIRVPVISMFVCGLLAIYEQRKTVYVYKETRRGKDAKLTVYQLAKQSF